MSDTKLTRTCPGCNWVFPLSYNKAKCKFCGTEFKEKFCNGCEQLLPIEKFGRTKPHGYLQSQCNVCFAKRRKKYLDENRYERYIKDRRFIERHKEEAESKFKAWKTRTNKPFKPLTEQQWLEACSYFGGCAICGNEHIEIRQFFVNFRDGGRYTAWNIYPMCGKCATYTRRIANPFAWLDRYIIHDNGPVVTEQVGKRLVSYLQSQIEKVEANENKHE